MNTFLRAGLLSVLTLGFALPVSADSTAKAGAASAPASISATVFGHFLPPPAGGPAWVGHMLLKIGDGPVQVARFVDRGDGPPEIGPKGVLLGTETITVAIDNQSTFVIEGAFEAPPAPTPGLFILHEAGIICKGTGVFKNLTGTVTITGPFVIPEPALNPAALLEDAPALWIGQLRGRVRGVAK